MRLRRGWRAALLVVLLIVVPTFEVWLLIRVGHLIGVVPTVAILVAEALLGAWLTRREGQRSWQALVLELRSGRLPTGELTSAALVVIGGVLLILPGFLTDVVGLLFLLPGTRPAARRLIGFFVARRVARLGLAPVLAAQSGTVIRGETVTDTDTHTGTGPASPTIIAGEIEGR